MRKLKLVSVAQCDLLSVALQVLCEYSMNNASIYTLIVVYELLLFYELSSVNESYIS